MKLLALNSVLSDAEKSKLLALKSFLLVTAKMTALLVHLNPQRTSQMKTGIFPKKRYICCSSFSRRLSTKGSICPLWCPSCTKLILTSQNTRSMRVLGHRQTRIAFPGSPKTIWGFHCLRLRKVCPASLRFYKRLSSRSRTRLMRDLRF